MNSSSSALTQKRVTIISRLWWNMGEDFAEQAAKGVIMKIGG